MAAKGRIAAAAYRIPLRLSTLCIHVPRVVTSSSTTCRPLAYCIENIDRGHIGVNLGRQLGSNASNNFPAPGS